MIGLTARIAEERRPGVTVNFIDGELLF